MRDEEYVFFDTIKIDDCEFIRKNYSMIANFGFRNKIETLGELVRKYENGDAIVRKKNVKN